MEKVWVATPKQVLFVAPSITISSSSSSSSGTLLWERLAYWCDLVKIGSVRTICRRSELISRSRCYKCKTNVSSSNCGTRPVKNASKQSQPITTEVQKASSWCTMHPKLKLFQTCATGWNKLIRTLMVISCASSSQTRMTCPTWRCRRVKAANSLNSIVWSSMQPVPKRETTSRTCLRTSHLKWWQSSNWRKNSRRGRRMQGLPLMATRQAPQATLLVMLT